jgi:hypothetical protein
MMFHNQRKRLLRRDNWTATDLAQELWAMFGPDVPLDHRGPITLYRDGEQPAIIYKNFGESDSLFRVDNGDDLSVYSPTRLDNPTGDTSSSSSSSTTGAFPGEVVSHVSGNNYLVNTYPDGLSAPAIQQTVRQMNIRSGATIKAGTWAMVCQTGDGAFHMMVPIWG